MTLRAAGLDVRQVPTIPESVKTGKVVATNAETFAPFADERTRAISLSSVMFHSGQMNDVKDTSSLHTKKKFWNPRFRSWCSSLFTQPSCEPEDEQEGILIPLAEDFRVLANICKIDATGNAELTKTTGQLDEAKIPETMKRFGVTKFPTLKVYADAEEKVSK
ncbi:pyridoxal phosphate-dependent transferase [Penicillium argentinense]|uniref:Pyridoxal phosphate-dependent transferase n=1 Tax=Penicillium argentinense TaxID=1131581 RepID=A0A9W9EYM9_9EURO|nr:pyridoxal phosphate-dependent transferase [Penicillium argentinense]KAJ5090367.1 pyridoxal phosphate-dependent transferase [Penicillium argentinense]